MLAPAMNSSPGKWVVRLLILAIGLLVATALVLALALAAFDDEDYRDALVWAAERYLDVTLKIDGELSIELGPTLALHAQGLSLQTNDGRVTASAQLGGSRGSMPPGGPQTFSSHTHCARSEKSGTPEVQSVP